MYDTAIYIGRFEPVHNGHLALLQCALDSAKNVIVVMGSAWQARSPKNPFTWAEREAMLRNALPEADRARLTVLPVRDHYNEALWVAAVLRAVSTHVLPDARIGLVGHFKDATSSYLDAFPGWSLIPMDRQGTIDATAIRDAYFGAAPQGVLTALGPLADQMPASTLEFLDVFARQPHYAALQEEWRVLRSYRESWAQAPYPPVFVTVDAVLRCQDHVLVIRRAHAPGKGQLAMPGGFIEQRETLWQSCLRELAEETHCDVPDATLRRALRATAVFDHPDRSQRGRTITHAHYFDLGDAPFPAVQADDDAMQVQWIPVADLAAMEEAFFEDHFHMLDHFLNLTGAHGAG
ncbi:bifunctional nicotinamide-nucleotide adenylyltransferase/Nudix hydroxylase [Acidovorax sp. SUPP2522]|uniref:bifunctional nicotinamide-nucleotide adenylyltransferase/Nudix hydroxylase n=1 Tax=unclassified Acidovorax TaxID=2684926 RepID=UPI002348F842|nr:MULTISPECIES: bifunctional nicotinamide-nucleotide adenylyltransferase/Nudix hydroxylase [unclassified Acidovorax]WCM98763.1 bifunctional nicotinamide-nucleotide adenylyltransferase/Nudix hydroxylase [Acidovorax sp. GBBC 1281]GKT19852.1 bifunctional nicotinamide-nucleotide adenylyltransferase/Nudix hydroxylase [Acidovorax sp. SUPP2522]